MLVQVCQQNYQLLFIDQNLLMQVISLGDNLLENGLIKIAESCSRLMNLKVLELAHHQTSPTQVINLVSAVNKCSSLELLSLSGICMNVNESIYLNVFIKHFTRSCIEAPMYQQKENCFV